MLFSDAPLGFDWLNTLPANLLNYGIAIHLFLTGFLLLPIGREVRLSAGAFMVTGVSLALLVSTRSSLTAGTAATFWCITIAFTLGSSVIALSTPRYRVHGLSGIGAALILSISWLVLFTQAEKEIGHHVISLPGKTNALIFVSGVIITTISALVQSRQQRRARRHGSA